MENDIKDIDELNEEEPILKDDYFDNKGNSVKVEKPKVEQHFDKRKLIALFAMIALISIIMTLALTLNNRKKETTEESNIKTPSSTGIVDVREETKTEEEKLEEVTDETDQTEIKKADDYDRLLEEQYSIDEIENIDLDSGNNTVVSDSGKPFRKSPIGFKKSENQANSTETVITPEQQLLMEQQALMQTNQNTGTVPIDTTPNRQESKNRFLNTRRERNTYSRTVVTPPLSKYEIKSGTLIEAVLLTEINSDLPGEILAQITRDIKDFRTLNNVLIPKGSKVLGRYDSNITYGQNRVLVVWERIIFPNGNSLLLDNYQGVDLVGNSGIKGKTNTHFWKLLRGVVLSSAVNMLSGALEDINVNINSSSRARVTLGAGASNTAQNIETIGSKIVERDLNQQPTIKIKRATRFNIFVNTDMILPVYKN